MQAPAYPTDESRRLQTLHALKLLDTAPEERFDRITRITRRVFDVPIALVTLIDSDRQWFKSCIGVPDGTRETSRDISFCGHTILNDEVLVIPDLRADVRFADNPLVAQAPALRFYAGCPLAAPNGSKLGTLCVLHTEARTMDMEERGLLRDLAHIVEQEIAAVHLASIDDLTALLNRRGFERMAQQTLRVCKRTQTGATLLYFDLNGFKKINDTFGHAEGDKALRTFGEALSSTLRESDLTARLSGDEFAALLLHTTRNFSPDILRRLRKTLDEHRSATQCPYAISYSVGESVYDPARHSTLAPMLAEADAAMYANKPPKPGR